MNQVFDFSRWLLLVGKHWSENRKKYLLSLAAILALMIIWYSFILLIEIQSPYVEEMQLATYYIGMAIVGCLFASLIFSELSSGPRAMHHLSVPASALEKLLTAILYSVVLFFICYTAIFYLVDYVMIEIGNSVAANHWKETDPSHVWKPMEVANVFTKPRGAGDDFPPIYLYFLLIYFNGQAAFLLGSIYFSTYSFIKTCISLLVVFLCIVFLMANVLFEMMPNGSFNDGFFSYRVMESESSYKEISLAPWMATTVKFLMQYGFVILFWAASYFRLKEKEV